MHEGCSPVILIGAARSGTKFLRDILAADTAFAKVPYDVNYVWRIGNPSLIHDELDPLAINDRQAEQIRATLSKLARFDSRSGQTLIEKSVSNTLRVPFVDRVFPQARYVHIVRDGRAVIESSARMWNAPPDKSSLFIKLKDLPVAQWSYVLWFAQNYARGVLEGRRGGKIWGPRYKGMLQDLDSVGMFPVVCRQWAVSVDKATSGLEKIPAARVFEIGYEDLVSNVGKLRELCGWLGVRNTGAILSRYESTCERGGISKWRSALNENQLAIVQQYAGATLARHGYSA